MEIAFISSNKIYLEIEKKQDIFFLKFLLNEKPSKFIAAMLMEQYCTSGLRFYGALLMRQISR
jgi:hypothetical protein